MKYVECAQPLYDEIRSEPGNLTRIITDSMDEEIYGRAGNPPHPVMVAYKTGGKVYIDEELFNFILISSGTGDLNDELHSVPPTQ